MRRLILLAVCIGLVASPASAGSKAPSARYACGAKKMTFYFWPQGHNAVPSLNFPAFATPHLEAYTTGGPFDASVDANGAFGYAKACKKVADLPARWPRGVKRTTTTTTVLVNCTFPAAADLKASKVGAGGLLIVTLGHTTKLVVMAAIKAAGSTITYDNRYCRTRAAPPQATPTKYTFSGLTASFSLHGAPISYALTGEVCGDPTTTPWSLAYTLQGAAQPAKAGCAPSLDGGRRGRDRLPEPKRCGARARDASADAHHGTASADGPERGPERQRHEHPGRRLARGGHRHAGRVLPLAPSRP